MEYYFSSTQKPVFDHNQTSKKNKEDQKIKPSQSQSSSKMTTNQIELDCNLITIQGYYGACMKGPQWQGVDILPI